MRGILLALAIGLAAGFGAGWRVHDWKAGAEEAVEQSAAETARLLRQANTIRVETRALVRRDKDAEALTALLRAIDREIPATACELPAAWRVRHDDAVRGDVSPAAALSDATPVSAADAAETVARNYAGARRNEGQLEDCQRYIREMTGGTNHGTD